MDNKNNPEFTDYYCDGETTWNTYLASATSVWDKTNNLKLSTVIQRAVCACETAGRSTLHDVINRPDSQIF